jgi:two-component system, OmpR family, response regulator ChvI
MKDSSSIVRKKPDPTFKGDYRILLVDDDADILNVLGRGLEVNGFHVEAFSSSKGALDAFKPDVYDLAILDIRMPGLDGFQIYREMKKRDPAITACFLSAFEIHPSEFEKVFPSLSEIKTIIKKPVSIHHLVSEIKPLLRKSAIRRAHTGDHIVVSFETNQELIEQSIDFLKVGLLDKDEDILLMTDALPKDRIREKITKEWNAAEDVNSLEQKGKISLMTFQEFHQSDGKFDAKRSKARMAKMAQKAVDNGRKGLRFVNDANTFFSSGMTQQLIDWELSLEKQFELPITLVCAYTEENIIQLNNSPMMMAEIWKRHNRMMTTR